THIHALDALGARIAIGQYYELEGMLTGTRMFLDEASVTATENAVMAAALAVGETVIGNAACEPHVQDVCRFLVSLGAHIDGIGTNLVRVEGVERLVAGLDHLCWQNPKNEAGPWPAFPADLTSIAVVLATQARGTILIFEKMFESRLFFVDKLVGMGARIIVCDPHRVVVAGPAKLYGQRMESPDIRAGMAMMIASMLWDGTWTNGYVGRHD